ncbi:MAG: hypothetical protein E6G02_10885 [Actinobacteria bacterium]|nr:MAG: hypothetical protein E6G02_10885 [Actinomycetota bacterium]
MQAAQWSRLNRLVIPTTRHGLIARLGVGLAVVAIALTLTLTSGEGAGVAPPAAAQRAELIANARHVADANGDPSVRTAEVIPTTRRALTALTAREAPQFPVVLGDYPDDPIFVVTLHGNFTLYGASVPDHTNFPTGHWLVLVVRTTNLELVEDHLLASPLDLTSLGHAETLNLGSS